jgi:hypothetical protein
MRGIPRILLGPWNANHYWVTNVTTTGFRLWTDGSPGECYWAAESDKP